MGKMGKKSVPCRLAALAALAAGPLWAAPSRAQAPEAVVAPPVADSSASAAPLATAGTGLSPATPAGTAATPAAPAPAAPAIAPSRSLFSSEPFSAFASLSNFTLKVYGDTGFAVRDNANQPWQTNTSNADVYSAGAATTFFAPRLDLFGSAYVDRLNFLTEIMFEGSRNSIDIDLERLQISYLFGDFLRATAGRSHLAWGYYNDTYHHGNIFELTTSRPYSVNFEDSFGILMTHLVGVGLDGTFKLGSTLARYDVEVGNPRPADITSVALEYAEGPSPTLNLRLRWMPIDGLILGINGMRDVIPTLASPTPATVPARPQTEELVCGAHVVYTEHHALVDLEGFLMRHNPVDASPTNLSGVFAELGYTLGAFTPYLRPEYIRFPHGTDPIFQFVATDPEGAIVGESSIYAGVTNFIDVRVGVKWMAMPQLALKLEGDRVTRDSQYQDIATAKAAFGF